MAPRPVINFVTSGHALSLRSPMHVQVQSRRPAVNVTAGARRVTPVCGHSLNGQNIDSPLLPANHNILVKIAEASDKTEGGIFLPEEAKDKPNFGEAVEVGPGKYLGNGVPIPMHVAKGDTVMYGQYGGTSLNYDGDKHVVITQDDILCKFSDGEYKVTSCVPIFDRLLVKVGEMSDETSGGLIISNNAKEKPTNGEVMAMGPGRFMENGEMEPATMQIGDQVYYSTYAGTNITLEGEDYVIVRVADIFAKV